MSGKPPSRPKLYHGALIQSHSLTSIDAFPRTLLAIDSSGVIAWLESDVESSEIQQVAMKHGWDISSGEVEVIEGKKGEWIMPGFVDTHTHASQFPNLGTGQQYELLDWLKNVTFPTEARFKDVEYARQAYNDVVTRVLNNGTTTCCYYATLHLEASKVLAEVALAKGQRAFVGKCNMDRNSPPDYIEPGASQSLSDTHAFISHVQSLNPGTPHLPPLVQPILTPRFAISCTPDLLQGIGKIFDESPDAAKEGAAQRGTKEHHHHPPLLLQTHISENRTEVSDTIEMFNHLPPPPDTSSHTYASIYDHYGLLSSRTILAHGVYLDKSEINLIKKRGTGISHCAGSNFNLRSGVASVGKWLEAGVKVGLGTDVSGGFSPSIITEIRHASIASKVRAHMDVVDTASTAGRNSSSTPGAFTSPQGLSLATLLHLATLGGASLCSLADTIGSFTPGKEFDALYISLAKGGNPSVWWDERYEDGESQKGLETMLERFLFGGDDRNVRRVWVRGREVGGSEFRGWA